LFRSNEILKALKLLELKILQTEITFSILDHLPYPKYKVRLRLKMRVKVKVRISVRKLQQKAIKSESI